MLSLSPITECGSRFGNVLFACRLVGRGEVVWASGEWGEEPWGAAEGCEALEAGVV